MLKNKTYRSTCPLTSLLDIIGDKWSLIIIRDLFMGKNTYGQFLNSPEGISTNILADRLKLMKNNELISYVYKEYNKKVKYYYLTNKGIDLYPIICEMMLWSDKHLKFKEMHPLGLQSIKSIKESGIELEIKETKNSYLKTRSELLKIL
ncbi:helix-turn-helix domain-containing protein [Winogradskyella sp. KYW1333]|uniref:winged helix-turn-helix transcriptional regulator n=1 Tax=Winogradskyella sp. KYW1333 TaxID=2282123 RepID=UPI001C696989|nr:helix-turn-helix domain-containing protein [Winogradskyella sp. KYW1333]